MCVLLIELPKTTNTRRDRVAKLVDLSGGTPLVALHTSHYFTAQTPPISAMSPMPCAKVTRESQGRPLLLLYSNITDVK